MKRMFITFVLALSFSSLINAQQQAPLDYQYARTDTIVTSSKTVPGNVWGGRTGMGTKWCNIAYSTPALPAGICIWRLTDATVFPSGASAQVLDLDAESASAQTDDDQKDNIISVYSGNVRYVIVRSTGGANAIIAFDNTQPSGMTATVAGTNLPGALMFDDANAGIIYARINHTQIWKYAIGNNGWSSYTPTEIFDFADPNANNPCLPPGSGYGQWEGAWGSATTTSLTIGTYHTWGIRFFRSRPGHSTPGRRLQGGNQWLRRGLRQDRHPS